MKLGQAFSSGFHTTSRFLAKYPALVAMAAMELVVVGNVFMRYALNMPLRFQEVLATMTMLVAVFAIVPQLFVSDQHLRVNIIADRLPPKIRRWGEIVTTTITLVFMCVLTGYFIRLTIQVYHRHVVYETLQNIPEWPQYAFVAFALILVSIFMCFYLFRLFKRERTQMTGGEGGE